MDDNTMMSIYTTDGYTLKVLSELIQNISSKFVWHFLKDKMHLCMNDTRNRVIIQVDLSADKFGTYHVPRDICLAGSATTMYKIGYKNTKRRDPVSIKYNYEDPDKLLITTFQDGSQRQAWIPVYLNQSIEMSSEDLYPRPIQIHSQHYQRDIKGLCQNVDTILVQVFIEEKYTFLRFRSKEEKRFIGGNICTYVYPSPDINEEVEPSKSTPDYEDEFYTDMFLRTCKIAALDKGLSFYIRHNFPLLISSYVGRLGMIDIYIKSKRMVDSENN